MLRPLTLRTILVALSASFLLAGLCGCGPESYRVCDNNLGGVPLPDGRWVDCCTIDMCSDDVEVRVACCRYIPNEFCTADVPCNLDEQPLSEEPGSTCMICHNGGTFENYAGPGLLDPHPFPGARGIGCVTCHGGDPTGESPAEAHVPRPPEIGDVFQLIDDPQAYEYFRTHSGVEFLPDYLVDGQTFSAIDWLQFVNPGATPVIEQGRGCAMSGCHVELGAWMTTSVMTTGAGIASALMDHAGVDPAIAEQVGWYGDTAADYGFRNAMDPAFTVPGDDFGRSARVAQLPERAAILDSEGIHDSAQHHAEDMADDVIAASDGDVHQNQLITGSPLHDVLLASATQACGQCHLGDRGRNRTMGEYRSSGCSACHMPYAIDGRSQSRDPQAQLWEPVDPEDIATPERSHPLFHRIASAGQVLPSGDVVLGIDDRPCASCHRQSKDIALQYYGVRIDHNLDVDRNLQYPANPNTFQDAAQNQWLFDPAIYNRSYQGYSTDQLLSFEDYDADGLDDTPFDIHYEAGMGCTDCHTGSDTHNGAPDDPRSGALYSRAEQATRIACESCHGSIDGYATTSACIDDQGEPAECATDRHGNPLPHVTRDQDGNYWLVSRQYRRRHYITQTRDVVFPNNARNPLTNDLVYNEIASYAMGRVDGDPSTGIGPRQVDPTLVTDGFSHSDRMDCSSCHAAWNNHRMGEYLSVRYEASGDTFSAVDNGRVAVRSGPRQPIYSSPVPFFLGVGNLGRISQYGPEMSLFFQYQSDRLGSPSSTFAFTDRRGNGNNPGFAGRGPFGALGYGRISPHTTRGRGDANSEGARQCVACHLNSEQLDQYGPEYEQFVTAMRTGDPAGVEFFLVQEHIGQNTGNDLNSPFFVHMAAGLGTGLWFFDQSGCPVNPLDVDSDRVTCDGVAPADRYDPGNVAFALDQPVTAAGVANASGHRPAASASHAADIAALRDGAHNPDMPGPLGATLGQRLADPNTGLILDSWIDSNGNPQGQAADFL